jgi:hypothetical protein
MRRGRGYAPRVNKPSFMSEMRLLQADEQQEDTGDESLESLRVQCQSPEIWFIP